MSPEGYQARTFAYWQALQMIRSQYIEELPPTSSPEMPPIAILKYKVRSSGELKEFEVKFTRQTSGALYATIQEIFTKSANIKMEETVLEEHIIHWGWFWNTKVSDMSVAQKTVLIDRLAKMNIYYIQDGNVYLY